MGFGRELRAQGNPQHGQERQRDGEAAGGAAELQADRLLERPANGAEAHAASAAGPQGRPQDPAAGLPAEVRVRTRAVRPRDEIRKPGVAGGFALPPVRPPAGAATARA